MKKTEQNIIRLPAFHMDAQLRSASFDEEKNTIDVVFTTGATVRRYSWIDGPYDEVLACGPENVRLDRLNSGAPFLNTHDSYDLSKVLGAVVRGTAKMQGGKGFATIQLSRAEVDAPIVQKIRDGVISNISAGYRVHRVVKTEGDENAVPTWDVVDWEPYELSAVPMPADAGAQIRSAPPAALEFECEFIRNSAPAAAAARMRLAERLFAIR